MICSNCESSLHAWCCARCGGRYREKKFADNDSIYCSGKCERDQMRDDKRSDAMETEAIGKPIALLVLLILGIANIDASADTFPVRASYGELVDSPRKCGPATRDEIRKFIADDLRVHVADALAYSTGSAANVAADKQYAQDGQTIGVWRRGKRSIVIALRTLKRGPALGCTITFLVEQDPDARDKVSCFERWVGQVLP